MFGLIKPCVVNDPLTNSHFVNSASKNYNIFEISLVPSFFSDLVNIKNNSILEYDREWNIGKSRFILITKQNYKVLLNGKKIKPSILKIIIRSLNDN